MSLLFIIPIVFGGGLAAQSAINAHLCKYVRSPFLASWISFLVGWILLVCTMLMTHTTWRLPSDIAGQPWWIWIGGLLGVFGMTAFILLFPVLGSVQTSILAIGGQILMGVLVDQFGWFASPVHSINWARGCGILLLIAGILLSNAGSANQMSHHRHQLGWQLLAVITGMVMASQSAINGHFGTVLHSSIYAVTISFTVSIALLSMLLFVKRIPFHYLAGFVTGLKSQWWIGIGGALGILFSLSSAWLVPILGTGEVVVCSLFGQLIMSTIIDQWGLFNARRNPVSWGKLIGIGVAFIGILLITFN